MQLQQATREELIAEITRLRRIIGGYKRAETLREEQKAVVGEDWVSSLQRFGIPAPANGRAWKDSTYHRVAFDSSTAQTLCRQLVAKRVTAHTESGSADGSRLVVRWHKG